MKYRTGNIINVHGTDGNDYPSIIAQTSHCGCQVIYFETGGNWNNPVGADPHNISHEEVMEMTEGREFTFMSKALEIRTHA